MHVLFRLFALASLILCLTARPAAAQVHPAPGDTIRFPLPAVPPNKVAPSGQEPSDVGPQLIGPSPEAASLGKFAQVPVSLYTGTPTISIPLYDIKSGPLVLPVALSYHASGIKLDEIPSWVGSGWALNAGGLVTRTVRGKPDDQLTYGFLTYSQGRTVPGILQESDNNRLITYSEIVEGCADVEPDVFSVNVSGITAQFMFDWNGAPVVYRSSQKIKIAYQLATNGQIDQWTITDDRGTVYTFRDRETTKETTLGALGCKSPRAFTSSWYVSEIADTNGENKILFTYGDYSLYYAWQASESYRWLIDGNSACGNGGGVYGATSRLSVLGKRIQRITTDNGTVTVSFVPATNLREDNGRLISYAGYNQDFVALLQVVVKNHLNEEIRTFQLEQDYSTNRLTLRKVYARNGGQNSAPPHQFDYESQYGTLPALAPYMTAQDHWGYYNGQTGNSTLLPAGWVLSPANGGYTYYAGANREPNSETTKYGVLNRIVYPTGGYTDLAYEAHRYNFIGSTPYSDYARDYFIPGVSMQINTTGNGPVTTTFTVNPDPNTPNQATSGQVGIVGRVTGATNLTKPIVRIRKSNGTVLIERRLGYGDTNESFPITLLPDTYTLEAGCAGCDPDLQANDYAYIGVAYYGPSLYSSPALAGGVRLKEQYIHEQANDIAQTIAYQYVMTAEPTRSSGVIYALPNYDYVQRTFCEVPGPTLSGEVEARYLVRVAQNTLDMALTQGSHVGYREVQATQGSGAQTNGKTVYTYTSPFDYGDVFYGGLPFRPAESVNYKTGLLTGTKAYKYDGSTFSFVQQTATDYAFSEIGIPGLRVNFEGGSYSTGSIDKFEVGPYTTNLGFAQPVHSTSTMWYDGSPVVSEAQMTYDAALQNVVSQIQTASHTNGEQRITELYYPQDFPETSLITSMISRNMLGVPLETITKFRRNGTDQIIGGSYQGYSLVSNNLHLTDVRKLRVPLTVDAFSYATSGTVDSRYDTEIEYSEFDGRGNYRQFIRRGGQPTTVLWGYKGQYPIAEVTNATFGDVVTALNNQALTPGSVGNSDDAATLRDRIKIMRTSLSGALVKSATYRPLVGMDSQTSPDGRTAYYEYDSFLRLQTVKENGQNIVQTHTYNYRNN